MVFLVSKLFWLIAQPLNTIVLLMIAGLALSAAGRARAGLIALNAGAIYLLAATIVPLGQLLLLPLEDRFEKPAPMPSHVDGIIVLGGAIDSDLSHARGEAILGEAAERVSALVALAHRYPGARLVYSGGNADFLRRPGGSESGVMRDFLGKQGVADGRVLLEGQSRTTWENVVFSQALLRPEQGERWLLVTSASHMARAVGVFRKRAWPVIPYPVDYRTTGGINLGNFDLIDRMNELDVALKEWIGLVAYYAMGRTAGLLPGP